MPCSPERPILASSPASSAANTPSAPRLTRQSSARIVGATGAFGCGGRRVAGVLAACGASALLLGVGYIAIGTQSSKAPPAFLGGAPAAGPAPAQNRSTQQAAPPAEPRHVVLVKDKAKPSANADLEVFKHDTDITKVEPQAPQEAVSQDALARLQDEDEPDHVATSTTGLVQETTTDTEAEKEEDLTLEKLEVKVEKPEVRKACRGGSRAACNCLLRCSVFGGEADRCGARTGAAADQNRNVMLHRLIDAALTSTRDACDGMRCIVDCARELQCFDSKVEEDCISFVNRTSQSDCQLTCTAGLPTLPSSDSTAVEAEAEEEDEEEGDYGREPFLFKK